MQFSNRWVLLVLACFFLSRVDLSLSAATESPVVAQVKINENKECRPTVFVLFGATGDLAARKLYPALHQLYLAGELPKEFACVGFARRENSHESFRKIVEKSLVEFSRTKPDSNQQIADQTSAFLNKVYYNISDFDQDIGYQNLSVLLDQLDKEMGVVLHRIYYLATPPQFFPTIVERLAKYRLVSKESSAEVMIEKPFGTDLDSAVALKEKILSYIDQQQVRQVDHFLGKEAIQNILNLRFANPMFEGIWNNKCIDNVQITIAEDIGIGTRGVFWEQTGMLRDIIQNHMMQIFSLVAMEPPKVFDAQSIQKEKVRVVRAIRPFSLENLDQSIVRGQYGPGEVTNPEEIVHAGLKGYLEEVNVAKDSCAETYVAAKLYVDNPRWKNVPFYIRAGKRLKERRAEIVITFKKSMHAQNSEPNRLTIRIQPDPSVSFRVNSKEPGFGQRKLRQYDMSFDFSKDTKRMDKDAYEHLFRDAFMGEGSNFVHFEELLASWELFSPVLNKWKQEERKGLLVYPAGSWGPKPELFFDAQDHSWYEDKRDFDL